MCPETVEEVLLYIGKANSVCTFKNKFEDLPFQETH